MALATRMAATLPALPAHALETVRPRGEVIPTSETRPCAPCCVP